MKEQEIEKTIKERIENTFHPDKIILFGSRARGDASNKSDYDILVVMSLDKSRRKMMIEIDAVLSGLYIGTDIVLLTPEEYSELQSVVGTVAHAAKKEGRILYEVA